MIYLYPANKVENLISLYQKVVQTSPLKSVLTSEIVLVQTAGMQHWLNLQLAETQGVSLNMEFHLPSQYLWQLVRYLVNEHQDADQTPYSREVLLWRIDALLADKNITEDDDFLPVNQYWQQSKNSALKRYQLSRQLADLFEQYLVFRPDWLHQWQQGNWQIAGFEQLAESVQQTIVWQGKLWQKLTQQLAYDPQSLIESAIVQCAYKNLPERISIFGINSLPPIWLKFLHALSEHTQVHFFYLNPCAAYWGDLLTEKQASKQLDVLNQADLIGNPILANWGAQGREFLVLLQEYSTIDIELFESLVSESDENSVLAHIQQDILQLQDKRQSPVQQIDNSIVITSAHSELREVQALHDYLLALFNQDKSLTPKDILVMCPQVEKYAPYIQAVFTQKWQDVDNRKPPLPCSIADRSSKDSDPTVIALLQLLDLPDSRFAVSQIIEFLRLPAIAQKFQISAQDIDNILIWINETGIHWGLDQTHKTQTIQSNQATTEQFSWHHGLQRLLLGFANGNEQKLLHNWLLMDNIEGEQAELLGRLCYFLERLQVWRQTLAKPKTSQQWFQYLTDLVSDFFALSERETFTLQSAFLSLVEQLQLAQYQAEIPLLVIKAHLSQLFSDPQTSNQFLVGQVTFCSLLPMRSIPFKHIAILGLNDGDYPRQRVKFGFDLLAQTPPKIGDRSRRGDDRYLLLEALICARKSLYLSYIGRQVKNNKVKQPSLLLQELMSYLSLGYGWQFDINQRYGTNNQLRTLPLQPYHSDNYTSYFPSFDASWLQFNQQMLMNKPAASTQTVQNHLPELNELLLADLCKFFSDSAKYYCNHILGVYFEPTMQTVTDNEPFNYGALDEYQLRAKVLEQFEVNGGQVCKQDLNVIRQQAEKSGQFPDLPNMKDFWHDWQAHTETVITDISNHIPAQLKPVVLTTSLSVAQLSLTISTRVLVNEQSLVLVRAGFKASDLLNLYLTGVLAQQSSQQQFQQVIGCFWDNNKLNIRVIDLTTQLPITLDWFVTEFCMGLTHPKYYWQPFFDMNIKKVKPHSIDDVEALLTDKTNPYIDYLFSNKVDLTQINHAVEQVWLPILTCIKEIKCN